MSTPTPDTERRAGPRLVVPGRNHAVSTTAEPEGRTGHGTVQIEGFKRDAKIEEERTERVKEWTALIRELASNRHVLLVLVALVVGPILAVSAAWAGGGFGYSATCGWWFLTPPAACAPPPPGSP